MTPDKFPLNACFIVQPLLFSGSLAVDVDLFMLLGLNFGCLRRGASDHQNKIMYIIDSLQGYFGLNNPTYGFDTLDTSDEGLYDTMPAECNGNHCYKVDLMFQKTLKKGVCLAVSVSFCFTRTPNDMFWHAGALYA